MALISTKAAAKEALRFFTTPFIKTTRIPPRVFESAEKLDMVLNNQVIRGFRWNKGQSHKVLILHGFSSSAYNFSAYIKPLLDKGYEVLAFDGPAHGDSEGSSTTAPEYARMVTTIHEKYGPITGFMGHSFGGLAICLALEQIKHSSSTRVVLLAPATETTTAVNMAYRVMDINNDSVKREFGKLVELNGGHPIEWYSISRALKNIAASILWIHDEDDKVTPLADAEPIFEQKYPNLEAVITKGLGHRRIYRDKEVAKKVVNFL